MERLLLAGPARLARPLVRGRVLVLAYHNIVPRDERAAGDRPLHVPQDEFAAQLDVLAHEADVIPLREIHSRPERARPRVVVTFDDAYAGALTAGVDELARRAFPATIFVAPALLDRADFWWDALASAGILTPDTRERLLHELDGKDARIRAWARTSGLASVALPTSARGGTEEQLRRAVAFGCSLGVHTWSHPNLAALASRELLDELARPLSWLRDRFPGALPWLAYPYGIESAAVRAAAAAAGYEGAFLVQGGWMKPGADRWALPRLNIPAGLSLTGFRLRLAGLLSG